MSPHPLTFGWVLEGPVRLQVWGAEKTRSRKGQRVGMSSPGYSQPPSCLGLSAESGPEECPKGGEELGEQLLGGLEMPLADLCSG